jgi:hypothetical protein
MWIWNRAIKPVLEWIGHYESVQSVLHTEFYKHWVGPVISGATTAWFGVSEGVPLMWVAVGTSIVTMAVVQTRLRADEWRDRKNPLNKIVFVEANVSRDLEPMQLPFSGTRQTRRAAKAQAVQATTLGHHQMAPGIKRSLARCQINVTVRNTASFPISVILARAETEIEGEKPGRTTFPKKPSTITPGGSVVIADDPIDLSGAPCGRLEGKLDMTIKYGYPGNEKYELHWVGDLDVRMEDWGLMLGVQMSWRS